MTSWSVITFAREQPEHLKALVAWYLGQGASEIHLMLDDVDPEQVEMFSHLPQVKAINCNAEYWDKKGQPRIKGRADRHIALSTDAYQNCTTDWVLHCDADEFADADHPISEVLDKIDPDAPMVRINAVERIFLEGEEHQTFTDHFRHMTDQPHPRWLSKIFAYPNQFRRGLRGHVNGKRFVRCGLDGVRLAPHNAWRGDEIIMAPKDIPLMDARLLHLFVFDFDHFQRKGEWKFSQREGNRKRDLAEENPSPRVLRRIEMSEIFLSGDIDRQRSMYDDMFVFGKDRLAKLRKYQTVTSHDFPARISRYMQEYFG